MRYSLSAVYLMLLLAVADPAGADPDTVWTLLEQQQQASGRFIQEQFDETGELLERSSGRYAVLRPDFFRWDIEYPDRQMILLTGGDLWHYDIDLASATRRSAADSTEFTPLELLGGKRGDLEDRFHVEELDSETYRMIPQFAGAGFASVDVSWKEGEIVAMEILDRNGQRLHLAMTPDLAAAPLSADDFELQLPDDVEVYDPDSP